MVTPPLTKYKASLRFSSKAWLATLALILLGFATTLFGFFPENPADFLIDGNVAVLSVTYFESGTGTIKAAWQQREKNLVGELGYSSDFGFSEGFLNYKLANTTNKYGFDLKLKVWPVDEFAVEIDAGVSVNLTKELKVSLGVFDLKLYVPSGQAFTIPTFSGEMKFALTKNFGFGLLVRNFGADLISAGLELALAEFPASTFLSVAYAPLYRWADGSLWNIAVGTLKIAFPNFLIAANGYYNFDGTVGAGKYLDSAFGGRVELGVRF